MPPFKNKSIFYRPAQKLIKSFAGGIARGFKREQKQISISYLLFALYSDEKRQPSINANCPKKSTRRRNSGLREFVFFVTIFGHKEFHSPQRYQGYAKDLRQSNILKRVHLLGILGIPTKITEGNTSF